MEKIPTKVKSPISNNFIEKGKVYDVIDFETRSKPIGGSFFIKTKAGTNPFCLLRTCAQINDLDWIIVETE